MSAAPASPSSQRPVAVSSSSPAPPLVPATAPAGGRRLPAVAIAMLVVFAADAVGFVVAVATDLASVGDAILVGTPVNAPVVFMAVQALITLVVVRGAGRRSGLIAAAVLTLISIVSVISGFSDGSYGYDGLTAAELAIQFTIVAATALAGALAAAHFIRGLGAKRKG